MVICDCGKRYSSTSQMEDVRELGLALMATCPHCDSRFAINNLWRKTEEQELPAEAWSTTKKHAECIRRHRNRKQEAT